MSSSKIVALICNLIGLGMIGLSIGLALGWWPAVGVMAGVVLMTVQAEDGR